MKKQLILAALSAALMAAPYADAASGFSRSKSSSGSSSSTKTSSGTKSGSSGSSGWGSSSGSSSSSPKRESSSSTSSAAAPKRDYGNSWGFGSGSRRADAAPAPVSAPSYVPSNRVTPQPRPVDTSRAAPVAARITAAPVVAAVPSAPVTSGFTSGASASTKKKVAAVAGATALGGALYAAQANHDAVAAYDHSQAAAAAPAVPVSDSTVSRNTTTVRETPHVAQATVPSAPSYHPTPAQPQVIIVQEASHPRHYSRDDALWDMDQAYRAGVRAAQRDARANDVQYGSTYQAPAVVPQARTSQPAVVTTTTAPAPARSSTSPVLGFLLVLALLVIAGVVLYLVFGNDIAKKKQAKQAAKKPNYTL